MLNSHVKSSFDITKYIEYFMYVYRENFLRYYGKYWSTANGCNVYNTTHTLPTHTVEFYDIKP